MEKFALLYVDDEASNLRIFKDTFRRNFTIYTALSAKEGIEILEKHKIDLVLSDQRMPEMTGVELLRYSLDKYPESNRILVTGYTDFNAIEDAINHARIFQYVQKPWEEAKLLKIIENALRIYQLDIDNKRQKAELIIAKERAERSDRLKTEFLNNLSHEIRTPMNAILGFSQFLEDDEITAENRKKYIKIIRRSGEQLLRIIDDILEISELETQFTEIAENQFEPNKLFLDIFRRFIDDAREKKLEFIYTKPIVADDISIISDETKIKKILQHLVENAIKYTAQGKIDFSYSLQADNTLKIAVTDTGIGISDDKFEKIFQRFSQEESELNTKTGGLGLGLAIVKETVKLLGGHIHLLSKKGKGSTFIIEIPYKLPEM